jgi:hypothetical protein
MLSFRLRLVRHPVALGTACSLMLAPVAPLGAAPRPAAVKPSPSIDGGWPKSYVTPTGASVTLYQPQVAAWKNQKQLTLYAAVAYTPSGATKPVLGTVTAEAQTKVAVSDRLVDFSVFTITDSNFPTLDKADAGDRRRDHQCDPEARRVIALDRVLAGIDKSQIIPKNNGTQSRSADRVLQHAAGSGRERQRRPDLGSDRGHRSRVRGQYQLGSVPAAGDGHAYCATASSG